VTARQTWLSRRAIGLHVVILVVIPTFAAFCDWQVHRAIAGNELSWAYVFEWPFFGGYAVYMWWRILHEAPHQTTPGPGPTTATATATGSEPAALTPPGGPHASPDATLAAELEPSGVAESDEDAAERAAYNRYLSELATRGRRKQWR